MEASIRLIGPQDSFEDLTSLLHRAYAELAAMGMRYLATWQTEEMTRQRVERGECWVAVVEGRLAGSIVFEPAGVTAGCAWYDRPEVASFHQFGVEPALQGRGIGSRLLAAVEGRAAETGAAELALDTAESADRLIRMYGKRGYRFVGRADWGRTNYESVILSKPIGRLRISPRRQFTPKAS